MKGIPDFRLDRGSGVPLYAQVAQQVEGAILAGAIEPGERLGNEVVLAKELGVSRPTMRQAIQLLVDKGMLVRKRGVGTQVVHGQVRRSVELTSLHDDLSRAGQDPRTTILSLGLVVAEDDVAAELRVPAGTEVWSLQRLRCIGPEPLAIMGNYLPTGVLDLDSLDLEADGLYAALRGAGIHLRVARQRIGARRATAAEGTLLGERRGSPLLTMQRTSYDSAGRAVEFGRHAYRPDLYAFELNLVDR